MRLDKHDASPYGDLEDDRPAHAVTVQGSYAKWQVAQPRKPLHPRGKRRKITTFSAASRLRMITLFNQLDWPNIKTALFCTLTYPDESDIKENYQGKRHRSEFWRKLERWTGHPVPAIWRQEWKQRQSGDRIGQYMPHYHILLLGEKYIPYELVNDWWKGVLHVEYVRTEITACGNKRHACTYVCKYAAKIADEVPLSLLHTDALSPGRHWGCFRQECMPFAPRFRFELNETPDARRIWEYALAGAPPVNKWGNESFTRFGPIAEIVGKILFDLPLTSVASLPYTDERQSGERGNRVSGDDLT